MAMHWGQEVLGGTGLDGQARTGVNALTSPFFCPKSKQPELKHAAVQVTPVNLPWRLLALVWLPAEQASRLREALKPWMAAFAYASCVPFGREPHAEGLVGVLFRGARTHAPSAEWLQALEALLGLESPECLRLRDTARGQHRTMRRETFGEQQVLRGILLGGDISSEVWLRPLLQEESPVDTFGRNLLVPGATPPVATASKGRQVCTCFNVSEPAIVDTLAQCHGTPDERLSALQGQLRCGTNCGSCVPELKKLIKLHPAAIDSAVPAA
jgi:assimilatory nitrate reductase catalytic subunit